MRGVAACSPLPLGERSTAETQRRWSGEGATSTAVPASPLTPTLSPMGERERAVQAATVKRSDDVTRLLRPRSIAIVGVSPEPGSLGGAVLANLEALRLSRRHPPGEPHQPRDRRAAVPCLDCRPARRHRRRGPRRCRAPVSATRSRRACDARSARRCVRGRASPKPAKQAAPSRTRSRAIARDGGMALSGPNCIGLVNYRDGVPLTYEPIAAAPADATRRPSALSRKAAPCCRACAWRCWPRALRLSHIVSTGNEAGFGAEDFLAFLVDDPETRAIVMFAEQIRRPRDFLGSRGAGSRARQADRADASRAQRSRARVRAHRIRARSPATTP